MITCLVILALDGRDEKYKAPTPQASDLVSGPDLELISPEVEVLLGDARERSRYIYDSRSDQCFLVISHVHQMGVTPVDCTAIGWETHKTQHE